MADQEYRDLAEEIASVGRLGDGWTVEPPSTYVGAMLTGPNGERLQLRDHDGNHKRVAVYGRYPRTDLASPSAHGITVDRARGPAVVAQEILRRMLDAYRVDLARVIEHNRHQADQTAVRTYNAGELAKILTGTTVHHHNHAGTRVHWYAPSGATAAASEVSIELSVDGQRAYTLELRTVPVELIEQILRLVKSATVNAALNHQRV